MTKAGDVRQPGARMERLATQMARSRADVAMWDLNIVVFLFAVLTIVIILVSLDVGTNVLVPVALSGLVVAWMLARRRGKRLFRRFYTEELSGLQQEPTEDVAVFAGKLTSREIEILNYVAQGYANKRIAQELNISINTVKNFISGILEKLDASDRTEAVVIAIRHGMISIR